MTYKNKVGKERKGLKRKTIRHELKKMINTGYYFGQNN